MKRTLAATVLSCALTATSALAAPILGGGSWQSGSTSQENLAKYWDGNSWDSNSIPDGGAYNPCNAGSLVAGGGCGLNGAALGAAIASGIPGVVGSNFSMNTPGGAFEYWGNADGSADMNFVYEETGAWYDFSMLAEFTDDWAINEFGWYDASNPNNRSVIFSAAQTSGAAASAFIGGNFGFYYQSSTNPGKTFFTQTSLNGMGNKQQFAAFQIGDQNFLGIEDIFSNTISRTWQHGTADYDYNDVMIGFTRRASVPEPGTLLFMGLGLAGAAARLRRKARA